MQPLLFKTIRLIKFVMLDLKEKEGKRLLFCVVQYEPLVKRFSNFASNHINVIISIDIGNFVFVVF